MQVAQPHDGVGPVIVDRPGDVLEAAVVSGELSSIKVMPCWVVVDNWLTGLLTYWLERSGVVSPSVKHSG